MSFSNKHLRKFLRCLILLFVAVFFQIVEGSAPEMATATWYRPGAWVEYETVPAVVKGLFAELKDVDLHGRNALVVKTLDRSKEIQYVSGLFSNYEEDRTLIDALAGVLEFGPNDLMVVKSLRYSGKIPDVTNCRNAVRHLQAAIQWYIGKITEYGVPLDGKVTDGTTVFVSQNVDTFNPLNLQRLINSLDKALSNDAHSEASLMVDLLSGKYLPGISLIVTSKLDMCSKCETYLSSTTEASGLLILLGAYREYPNDKLGATRRAGTHNPTSILLKTILEGRKQKDTAIPFPPMLLAKMIAAPKVGEGGDDATAAAAAAGGEPVDDDLEARLDALRRS